MNNIRKAIFIILITIAGADNNPLKACPLENTDTCEVLLIGSSYFNFNNLADLIQNLADDSDFELSIEMFGQNGLYLSDHASSQATEAKINERDWDYVILQGVGVLVAYPDDFTNHPVYPALEILREKIISNCESTRMVFCLPWAFEDGMTWYEDWTDTYEDMQLLIYQNTLQYSDEIGFEIAPVGWAWYAVLQEFNYPLHYLHLSDWNHPSLRGSYLMACVIYSTIFQESSTDITYYAGIPEEEADFFQIVASDTVLTNLELWNIEPLSTRVQDNPDQNIFYLHQNYPNPFKSSTIISYNLPKKQRISIVILDSLGRIKTTLVDSRQRAGYHEVLFNGSGLESGVYFCRINWCRVCVSFFFESPHDRLNNF